MRRSIFKIHPKSGVAPGSGTLIHGFLGGRSENNPSLRVGYMTLRLLRPILLTIALAPLAGCVRDQRHQLYACNSALGTTASQVITCMSQQGYRPDFGSSRCRGQATPYVVAICYRPRDLIAGVGFSIERLFRS
jgi:hypothetical protein